MSGYPGAGYQAYRGIYPPPADTYAHPGSEIANSQEPLHDVIAPAYNPREARKYTAEDWIAQRPEITRLYKDNTLDTVVKFMREQHGLDATPRQYKDRLKKWGLNKHVQSSEMEAVVRKQREREAQGKQSVFHIRGQLVSQEKINRYRREHPEEPTDANENTDADLDIAQTATPEAVTCHTPPEAGSSTSQEASSSQERPDLPPRPSQHFSGYGSSQPPPFHSYDDFSGNAPPPPPQGPVNFGHGAPQSYTFQYSQCTGRRKALLIGINYFGQRGQLRGCINDVRNMSSFLYECYGYLREDMVILTDDQQNQMSQPTKQNLLRAMHWLVKDARPNDSLFFHYSGHGGQTKDLDGDEEDGYDEVIYPVDFRQAGHIVDDEMHNIMIRPLQPGVRLTAIFDSCHSATALELPYIYSTQGMLKEPNLAKEASQGLLGVISEYSQGSLGGVNQGVMGFFKKSTTDEAAYNRSVAIKTSPADVVMWSNSKDDQTSLDANIATQATGAMSWAFITAMKKNSQQSYVQLLSSIRDELASKYTMEPRLSCSHPLNTDLLFMM